MPPDEESDGMFFLPELTSVVRPWWNASLSGIVLPGQ
jgi:hypothetical protein